MSRRTISLGTLAALLLAVAPAAADAAVRSVAVRDDVFAPERVRIRAGDTVRWVWRGRHRHDVAGPSFGNSGVRRRGTFSVRFRRSGHYRYYCTLHDGMAGTVVVRQR